MIQTLTPQPTRPTEASLSDYAPRVYNLARRMLDSDADAEDVTQEVLLTAIRKLPLFRGDAALETWLHRITLNAVFGFRRKQAVRQERAAYEALTGLNEGSQARMAQAPDTELVDRETKQLIERAIATLPDKYRQVYVLADVDEKTNAEIAQELGLSLPAVKSQLHRARRMMRSALAAHFDEPSR
jgi:RNA polymerase sigma-70 factor (ECF subfamily)